MVNNIKNKVEILKEKAKIFLNNNYKAFILDIYNNYHFCIIRKINGDDMIIFDFKDNEERKIFFIDIIKFDEYKGKE